MNIYDLSPANDALWAVGFGLHHSGVEILGTEYSFASGGGIFENTPKQAAASEAAKTKFGHILRGPILRNFFIFYQVCIRR